MAVQLYAADLLLLRAFCASFVMASASSRMISLKPERKMVLVLAKLRIWPRTMPMPLSSEAFSCGDGESWMACGSSLLDCVLELLLSMVHAECNISDGILTLLHWLAILHTHTHTDRHTHTHTHTHTNTHTHTHTSSTMELNSLGE